MSSIDILTTRFLALPLAQQALLSLALLVAFAVVMAAIPARRRPRSPLGAPVAAVSLRRPQAWAGPARA